MQFFFNIIFFYKIFLKIYISNVFQMNLESFRSDGHLIFKTLNAFFLKQDFFQFAYIITRKIIDRTLLKLVYVYFI